MIQTLRTLRFVLATCLTLAGAVAPASAASPPTTLRVAAHYTAKQAAPLLACFKRYEAAHPGLRIDYQQVSYRDYLQTVLISRVGRSPADIYNLYSIWAPQLIGVGALDRPPPSLERLVRAAYTPATVQAATIGGRLWGMPSAVSVYQLVYNRRMLAAAGYRAPPRTWAELATIGAATVRRNRQGNVVRGGYAFGTTTANIAHTFYAQMYAAGVPPFTADGRGTNLRSPAAARIVREGAMLFRRGITSHAMTVGNFAGRAAAMTVLANWQKSALAEAFGDRFSSEVGVAPIPTDGPGGTMIYSFFWGVERASPSRPQAWALIRWLNEARGRDGLTCTGRMLGGMGDLTGNRADLAAMRGQLADPFSRGFVAALEAPGARPQANVWHAEEIDRLLRYYIELAWYGRMSPPAALATADREIRAILAEQPR
ncbi:extracellular solute-binding protein [Sphingomonas jatrophae]|uniref:Carbohydrate ABC transporter substrate-binding protein, CUT1 family n=1 Tax=Sphingomonas jatrophae TaxID=1166337 RepID=A0A1I6M9Z8_9SPHN|nr:extracellular solute-binding protein [Sphingomonas jatrophae]SFS12467.1 carbohydrate ABC transporter substrate-binding protein, CUT1 family [Sphingomonas jatrophae]